MTELVEILVPLEQEGTKAVVRNWLKKVGETVALDDPLVELETDKVTQEVQSLVAGTLEKILIQTDEDAKPGAILGQIRLTGSQAAAQSLEKPALTEINRENIDAPRFSPAVRRAAEEYEIDPASVSGTGKGGRVTRADMEAADAAKTNGTVSKTQSASATTPERVTPKATAPSIAGRGSRLVPHSSMRRAIAKRMLDSVTTAPHVTAVFEADFTAITRHRESHKAKMAADAINLTYTAYIIMACVAALRKVPEVNSRWHDDHLEIFDDIDIGVGTALGDKGLVVPVIPQAQHLSLSGIAAALQDLTVRGRAGTLTPPDVKGGTFTISNHGVSGSLFASPIIINQPQVAILGVGKLEKRVVIREIDGASAMQIRPMAYVSLTIDHRALDGHQTNAWLSQFVETLENWPT